MDDIILHASSKEDFKKLIAEVIKEEVPVLLAQKEPDETLLTRKEVAAMLKITLATLHNWTKEKILPVYRIGNAVRYKKCDVEQVLNRVGYIKHSRYRDNPNLDLTDS